MTEPDVSDLLTVEQAIAIIDAEPVHPRPIALPLAEAMGLRLAEPIAADRDYPPFDKSLMDGYAVRAADLKDDVTVLNLVGEIAAGAWPQRGVLSGEAMGIMTGAPMPPGADGVVPVEFVDRSHPTSANQVALQRVDRPSRFIAKQGDDARNGQPLLPAGMRLGPAQLAVAGSVGAATVRVFARPRVAIIGSGDEVVPIYATPAAGQIRNANNLMLAGLLKRLGCDVTDLGVVRDEPADVRNVLERARAFDAMFITGGMSMGQYDYVPRVLREMGAALKVTKLRIKPGKPFVFATIGDTFAFGLPGNPVSAFVCTLRLAARLISRLSGGLAEPAWRVGALATGLPANGPREFYQPAMFDGETVHPLKWRGSADVYTLAAANALIVHPENAPALAAGDRVRLLEIPQ
ncbi:MAG TPA: gephyrin-like molybdotransferase Glp [Tepidisphaeraceae bacterium]|jgi:molybdopterin molybdotransferase|nr:gephyrin-like molybdotransferase Glp [Tepidisphaeraceae bacterium]